MSVERYRQLFKSYTEEAFRLETLPFYKVEGEWELFQQYLETRIVPEDPTFENYLNEIRDRIASGANHIRFRVFEDEINDYQIFETKLGYIPSSKVGTKVIYLTRSEYNKILEEYPQYQQVNDFWLFDNKDIVFVQYNQNNEWTGAEFGNENDLIIGTEFKSLLLSKARPLSEMLERYKDQLGSA